MGYSGPAGNVGSRLIAPEIWLEIIKNAMPSVISVTKKVATNTPCHGFHLKFVDSFVSFIMKLARLNKTWYSEVKEALYALPVWRFDGTWSALYHFLIPFESPRFTSFEEYDATISRIRRVELWKSRPAYLIRHAQLPVSSLWGTPDLLSSPSRQTSISICGMSALGGVWYKVPLYRITELIPDNSLKLTAKLGEELSKVLLINACFHVQYDSYTWSCWIRFPLGYRRQGFSADEEQRLLRIFPRHLATVLSKPALLAAARNKEAELLKRRRHTSINARIAAKVPKGHVQLRVKRVDKLIWGVWSKAPEPMGSRLPRRAKGNAIYRMSGLSRKRPRIV